MTRLFMSGGEAGHVAVFPTIVQAQGGTFVISAVNPRTGAYSFLATLGAFIGTGRSGYGSITINPTIGEVFARSFVRFEAVPGGTIDRTAFITILDDIGTRHISVCLDPAQNIQVMRGAPSGGVQLGGNVPVNLNQYYQIEVRATIADAGGICQVRVDGALVIDFTGDTRNAGNAVIGEAHVGAYTNDQSNVGAGTFRHDDIVINDTAGVAPHNTWPGNTGIHGLVATGAGTYTELATLVGAATHWQAVSEIPPDDAVSYVADTVVDRRDTFAMANMPVSGDVRAVQWLARAIQDVAGAASIARMYRIGAVDYQGADQAITTAWAYYREILALSPATGVAWTTAEIDAMEAGVRVR